MLLRQACRLCGYPRRVTVATMEDGCVVGKAVSEVSPSVPGEQVLSHAAQKHAQGPEGPSPGVQRGAIRGRPRRNSSGRGTLAWQRPSTVRVLVMSSETAVPISLHLHVCHADTTHVQSVERSLLGLEEDQCLGLQEARDCLVERIMIVP
ncbi:hypothetical protein GL50803_0027658 [Giardia duodenalis]|uniref:Uncharacterized protein n=1 Tax=Giardia intestinalis (strain ATCC 50803 / WB clone C6) TaxID=184922 RepID=A8B710_GIAIC|nr:hypothetical protein GL50803_0027658 [Giardia intestinalis]KAE8301810.1 hypothetical protein GL50803_0027658 [Giardia intestinalis]|eukprot:XP_001709108.1 Hypothetical protein GL50803_27658 [Giardia lamblia ATCC 50803]